MGARYAMRHFHNLLCSAFVIAVVVLPARASDMQPHRALYSIALANAAGGADVVSASGAMIYRFARACDGWTVENRTFLRLLYENDTATDTLWSFASWESADGLRFRFHTRYDQDGRTVEKLEGQAVLQSPGGSGTAQFAEPQELSIDLPAGTIFPTEHVRQTIAAAESGRTVLSRIVFDGASVDNPYMINAVFGSLPGAEAEALAERLGLPARPAWWTRMAFYPLQADDAVPEFEMGAQYRSDGIAERILQTFDDFSLEIRLKEIELLPTPDC